MNRCAACRQAYFENEDTNSDGQRRSAICQDGTTELVWPNSSCNLLMSENIGFVGVGRMGANMARRLKDRGYNVVAVYDINTGVAQGWRRSWAARRPAS